MNDLEIESLLFKQVEKPKHLLMVKITNIFSNRYRINLYTQTEEEGLIKKKIAASYFCHYNPGKLEIIQDIDKKPEDKKKKTL
jgi:3-polyprenyl-4-hydroxybenzoate decarboxylase